MLPYCPLPRRTGPLSGSVGAGLDSRRRRARAMPSSSGSRPRLPPRWLAPAPAWPGSCRAQTRMHQAPTDQREGERRMRAFECMEGVCAAWAQHPPLRPPRRSTRSTAAPLRSGGLALGLQARRGRRQGAACLHEGASGRVKYAGNASCRVVVDRLAMRERDRMSPLRTRTSRVKGLNPPTSPRAVSHHWPRALSSVGRLVETCDPEKSPPAQAPSLLSLSLLAAPLAARRAQAALGP
jgi:hypothetical protein